MSKSLKSATKTLHAAFKILKEAGGELPVSEIIEKVKERVPLTAWELQQYEKSGSVRWATILLFYSIDATKAGLITKTNGKWVLTKEGEQALKLGPEGLMSKARGGYKDWQKNQQIKEIKDDEIQETDQFQKANLSQLEEKAISQIKDYLQKLNPYQFQDLVAALLNGMGYYISHVSPRGKDGGVDIIAYPDPLGIKTPHIKVQVKHMPDSAISIGEVNKLIGVLNRENDVGIFVTSGNFSNDSIRASRNSHRHIELIDFTRFVVLWREFYEKFSDEQKNLLPLKAVYFLGSNE